MASDGAWMTDRIRLGRSELEVPRLGVGAMTWGSPSGRSRWGPAKLAYGGPTGPEEEQLAFEASLSAGVDLFDTAAMYSGGASERRVGELAEGTQVIIATKFPPGWRSTAEVLPDALDQSLGRCGRSRKAPCSGGLASANWSASTSPDWSPGSAVAEAAASL